MTLKQTIDVGAKSYLKGIIPFTDVSFVANRWVFTKSMRSQIANRLLEIVDMKNYDSGNKELNKHRIQRDKKDLKNLKQ